MPPADALFDQATTKIGINSAFFSAPHRFTQLLIFYPFTLRKPGKWLGHENLHMSSS